MAKKFDIHIKQLPQMTYPADAGFVLRPAQRKQYEHKVARLRAYIAAGSSGKTVTQIACAIREMRESGFMQRQLIGTPQSQIGQQFAKETLLRLDCTEKCYDEKTKAFTCNHKITKWHVRPDSNLTHDTSTDVLDRLEAFIMRPFKEQQAIAEKLKTTKTFNGLVLVTTHAAIARCFTERILPKVKSGVYTKTQVKRAVESLTNRVDESHHCGGFGSTQSDEQNGLGAWLNFCYKHGNDTSRVFLTTATPYREVIEMIAGELYKKFEVTVMTMSEWLPNSGIEQVILTLEEYDGQTPMKAVAANVGNEPKEKHLGIQPSEGTKWMKGRDKNKTSAKQRKLVAAALPAGKIVIDTVDPIGRHHVKKSILDNPNLADYTQTNMVVREGVDIPCISRIHHTAMEASKWLSVQTLYRCLRPYEGKKKVELRYYVPRMTPCSKVKTREDFSKRVNVTLLLSDLRDLADPLFSVNSFKSLGKYAKVFNAKEKVSLDEIFTVLNVNGDDVKEAVYLALHLMHGKKTKAIMLTVINDALKDAGISQKDAEAFSLANYLLADYLMNLDEDDATPAVAAKIQKMKFALSVDPTGYLLTKFDGIEDDGVSAYSGSYTAKSVATLTDIYAKYRAIMESAIKKLKKAKLSKSEAWEILTDEEKTVAQSLINKKAKGAL